MDLQKLRWGLPFLSALMFWASFHPLNLGFLGYLTLVPLLIYAQSTSGNRSIHQDRAARTSSFPSTGSG